LRTKRAKGLCPPALSHPENDFPGPLKISNVNNRTKMEETQFRPGVMQGQSTSILFSLAIRFQQPAGGVQHGGCFSGRWAAWSARR
jgi:hypothetical protein